MRAKPILTLTLLATALLLPGTGAALGLGKLTVNSALGQPLSAQIELTSAAKEELDSLAARVADPSLYRQNNLHLSGSAIPRARLRRPRCERRALPADHDTGAGQRAVPRLADRNQLGIGSRRPRLHVPARSAGLDNGCLAGRAGRSDKDGCRAGTAACAFGRAASGGSAEAKRRHVYRQARRHVVEDRDRESSVDGHAGSDAGCVVPQQQRCLRRQEHESPSYRSHHHDPQSGRSRGDGIVGGDESRARASKRLALLPRSCRRRGSRSRGHGRARRGRQDRHGCR